MWADANPPKCLFEGLFKEEPGHCTFLEDRGSVRICEDTVVHSLAWDPSSETTTKHFFPALQRKKKKKKTFFLVKTLYLSNLKKTKKLM